MNQKLAKAMVIAATIAGKIIGSHYGREIVERYIHTF